MKIIVEARNTPNIWRLPGTTATLEIYANQPFETADGQSVLAGNPSQKNFYLSQPCTIDSQGRLLIPAIEIDSTTDAFVPSQRNATYSAFLRSSRNKVVTYVDRFSVPATVDADGNPAGTTWGTLILNKNARTLSRDLLTLTRQEIIALVDERAGQLLKASDTRRGIGKADVPPEDSEDPVFVGTNSPLISPATIIKRGTVMLSVPSVLADEPTVVTDSDPRVADFQIVGTDNTTVDTAALQAAITELGVDGGVIRTGGTLSLDANTLVWPAPFFNKPLTFEVYGAWRLMSKLTLGDRINWVGLGGSGETAPLQISGSPVAEMIPPAGSGIALQIEGSRGMSIKNLSMASVAGTGIRIGGTGLCALMHLDNVGIYTADTPGAIPLVIDTTFWVWLDHCAFSSFPLAGPSVYMTSTFTGSYVGYIYFRDTLIAGHGMKLDSTVVGGAFGDIFVKDMVYESGLDPMLTFDLINVGNFVGGSLFMDGVTSGDSNNVPSMVKVVNASLTKMRNLVIHNSFSQGPTVVLDTDGPLLGVDIQLTTAPNAASLDKLKEFTYRNKELLDQRWAGANAGMSPSMVPGTALNIPADMAGTYIFGGTGTLTAGQPAPDGSATALEVVEGTGVGTTRVNIRPLVGAAGPVSVGDWFIAGYWAKAADAALRPTHAADVSFNDSALRFDDGGSNPAFHVPATDLVALDGESWRVISHSAKVTTVTTPGASLLCNFDIFVYNTKPTVFWQPFIIKIPASLGYTFADVIRFQRYLTTIVPAAPQGAIALHAHQKLYFGGGTFATKPVSPAQITSHQNDYAPGISYWIRLTSDVSRNITGMFTSQVDGEAHLITNVDSQDKVLTHQDVGSAAANRFLNSTGADITLTAGQAADAIYDGTTARWRLFKRA